MATIIQLFDIYIYIHIYIIMVSVTLSKWFCWLMYDGLLYELHDD